MPRQAPARRRAPVARVATPKARKKKIMPDLDPATTAPTATLAPAPAGGIRRINGRLLLTLDVTALHAYLRALNVESDGRSFVSAPPPITGARSATIDANSNTLQPSALCAVLYKRIGVAPGTSGRAPVLGTDPLILEWDLAAHYSVPPTGSALKALAASVEKARDLVIAHYAPVEISIVVSPLKRADMIAAHPPATVAAAPAPRAARAPDLDDEHDEEEA